MNGPNDPNQGGYPPQGQGYPPPHGQPPYGQPHPGGGYPPHAAPAKSNTALLVTLIVLLVAAIAGAATLYFTGAFGGGTKTAQNNASVGTAPVAGPTTPAAPGPVAQPTTPTNPTTPTTGATMTPDEVAARLQAGVAQFQPRLPLRNGPATITSVSSSGTVLTMNMEISQAVTPAEWAQLQGEFQRSICSGQFSAAIREGASAQVNVSDTAGQSRTYTIASC